MDQAIASPETTRIERWGIGLLWSGLLGGAGGTLALAWIAPALVLFVPLAIVGAVGVVLLFRHPALNLGVVLAGYVVLITTSRGITVTEIVYGLYYLAYLVHWYGVRLVLYREQLVRSRVDWMAALLIVFGLFGGAALGLVMGARPGDWAGEVLAFLMILFYFPIKDACVRYRNGPDLVFAALIWFGVFVAIRNALGFREALESATRLIEISGARAALNEVHILMGVLSMLVFIVMVYQWRTRILLLFPFFFFVAALLMTKARGFWVDALFGVLVLFFLLSARERGRLLIFAFGGFALFTLIVTVAFSDLGALLVAGVMDRFSTLGDAAVADLSLVNRFNETASVWEKIRVNPILGYGLGASHTYYDWVDLATLTRPFVHNGFVALWFKFGLWGPFLVIAFWAGSVWEGIQAHHAKGAPLRYRAYALSAAILLIAILPSANTSAPFFIDDSLMSFVMICALCTGLRERFRPPGPSHFPPPHAPPTGSAQR